MCLIGIFGNFKPKSPFHDGLDKIAVIAFANVYFKGMLVLGEVKFSIDLMGIVDKEEKFFKLVNF